jgi:hypothetical protein
MAQRVNKRSNDQIRNLNFEYENDSQFNRYGGVSRATPNTINGPWAENRGRRGDQVRTDNPFENGRLYNWNRREGWDEYYGGQSGRGPRGYLRRDERIMDDVCELLTRDRDIDASQVDVKVEAGVVTLTGKVEDRNTKKYAGLLAERVSGVKDIHNLLEFYRR